MPKPERRGRPRWVYRLEYGALLGVGAALRALPERASGVLAGGLGHLAGGVLRFRRRVVDANLSRAFPELDARERDRIAVASYRHVVREGTTLLGSTVRPIRAEWVLSRSRCADEGTERTVDWLRARASRGEGTLLLTGHLGNWELAGALLCALGVPVHAVAVRQRNPLFDRRIRETRSALGMSLVSRNEAKRSVPRLLREGRTVAMVADQHSLGGVSVEFFGHPVRAARGPAIFALRTGAPVLLGFSIRESGWPARYALHLEPLSFTRQGSASLDIPGLAQAYMDGLERYVRRDPEQYLWHHKVWRD